MTMRPSGADQRHTKAGGDSIQCAATNQGTFATGPTGHTGHTGDAAHADHDRLGTGPATRRTWLDQAIPVLISAVFHVGLMLIVALLTLATVQARPAETLLTATAPPQPFEMHFDVLMQKQQHNSADAPSDSSDSTPKEGDSDLDILASKGGGKLSGLEGEKGTGKHRLVGTGDGGPPDLVPTTTARNIVFVLDSSGSMVDEFDFLREKVCLSVGWLNEKHRFHVLFYRAGTPLENPPKRLVLATDEAKIQFAEFVQTVVPFGVTDPIPALRRAFEVLRDVDPKGGAVICLLTDGQFGSPQAVLDEIDRLNAGGRVAIHTYLYGYRSAQAEATLRKLAEKNGGTFSFVESSRSPDTGPSYE